MKVKWSIGQQVKTQERKEQNYLYIAKKDSGTTYITEPFALECMTIINLKEL